MIGREFKSYDRYTSDKSGFGFPFHYIGSVPIYTVDFYCYLEQTIFLCLKLYVDFMTAKAIHHKMHILFFW
jgi:hypothetical protein